MDRQPAVSRSERADPQAEYERRLQARATERGEVDRTHLRLGVGRLALVATAVLVAWAAWSRSAVSGWWLLVVWLAFVTLGGAMRRQQTRRTRLDRAMRWYERGLQRIADRWTGTGPTGGRFRSDEHPYARDLDLFGRGSLFQLLCAARTGIGKTTLAHWLLGPAAPDEIRARQEAVEELSRALDLREDLAVLGDDVGDDVHPDRLVDWGEAAPVLDLRRGWRAAALAGSVAGLAAVAGLFALLTAMLGLVELTDPVMRGIRIYAALAVAALGTTSWRTRKKAQAVLHAVEEAARELTLLSQVLRRIEIHNATSALLRELLARLGSGEQRPSQRIGRLARLMELADSRDNFMVRLFGPLVLWDLQLAQALESWRSHSGAELRTWLEVVGVVEALASLGRFRFERTDTVFPEIVDEAGRLEATGLGHPLLPADILVRNDVALGDGAPHVLIVSGSNMSGKSTLLRTVGVNVVLALCGAPVRAHTMRVSSLAVAASLRIQDSLRDGTSRFYAEILRLRQLVEIAGGEMASLFLIDEFLHGTNSHDRRAGAEAIVKGLVERGAIGLVTTHDLALTAIADGLGDRGDNVHFADELVDGRLHFDYRMRRGIVQRSNAIELMRSVGLEV